MMKALPDTARATEALDTLLVAGSSRDVRERYRALPQLARTMTLSLAERPVIICDTETTGLSCARDALLEIAALRVEGPDVLDEFHTFVDPGRPIPADITRLTGIRDADVRGAPAPEQALAAFCRFAGADTLVAHNAAFDRGFLARHAPEDGLAGTWVDTLALAQITLPRLTSHRLADLAAAFGLHTPQHRARDDARALAGLWRIMLTACATMAPGLARRIASLGPQTPWGLRPLFEQAAAASSGPGLVLRELRRAQTGGTRQARRQDADEIELRFAPDDEIAADFGPQGMLARMYDGYEPREPQAAMALEINDALRTGSCKALEAGTGVGKSMAYLVPLARMARLNHIGVGVTTKTNALMDQLVYHELPRLARQFDGGLSYVTLKGYEHYVCLRKLEAAAHGPRELEAAELDALATLYSFVSETPWGDLDVLNVHWPQRVRMMVQASSRDCLKTRCPFYPTLCYLHGARRMAACADIVVTNHALLFRDASAEGTILPPVRHWVVDEAHAAEDEARRQFTYTCSAPEIERLLARLTGAKGGLVATVRTRAGSLEGGSQLFGVTARVDARAAVVNAVQTSFFSYVKELADAMGRDDAGYERVTLWVGPELRESGPWCRLERPGASLAEKLEALVRAVGELVLMLEQFEGAFDAQQAELSAIGTALHEQSLALSLVLDGTDGAFVYSADIHRDPERHVETLCAARLDIGAQLLETLYPNVRSVVFTSATLATGSTKEPFAHIEHALGLDQLAPEKPVSSRAFASSYDFDGHMSVLLATDMPAPGTRAYRSSLVDLLFDVHVAMGGSVLTLFTNRREMEALYHTLRPLLEAQGIELAAQLRGSSPQALRERFLANRTLSLFALKSFWEGFDAPGETLRCVVIAKLPFPRPTDPLSLEREAREGHRAWAAYCLPEAVISLKQAAGRLIRSSHDEGWLVLCDARLHTKSYGTVFLRAMPTRDIRPLSCEDIATTLREQRPGLHDAG